MSKFIDSIPHLVSQWHPTKNGDITPCMRSFNSHHKAWWLCDRGHTWEATVGSRASLGRGCPCCAGRIPDENNSLSAKHPSIASEWHPFKNGTLKPSEVTCFGGKKVWWKCANANDHEWQAVVSDRVRKLTKCPFCIGRRASNGTNLAVNLPHIASQWHPHKNGSLTPRDVTRGSRQKAWWRCDRGHEWEARITGRIKAGCPTCGNSQGEEDIGRCLDKMGVKYSREYRFVGCRSKKPLPFDFAILSGNNPIAVIEYHGIQHYKAIPWFGGDTTFMGVGARDRIKMDFCHKSKLPFLVISHSSKDEIEHLVEEFIESIGSVANA